MSSETLALVQMAGDLCTGTTTRAGDLQRFLEGTEPVDRGRAAAFGSLFTGLLTGSLAFAELSTILLRWPCGAAPQDHG